MSMLPKTKETGSRKKSQGVVDKEVGSVYDEGNGMEKERRT